MRVQQIVFLKRFITAYTQLSKTIDVKGDGSVWHAKKGTNLRNSILRLDFCFLQTCQTEPSPLSPQLKATSRSIIRAKPRAKPMVPMLECSPSEASGMSSSTTT